MWDKLENIAKGVVWGLMLLVLANMCTACKSSKQAERILVSAQEGVRVTKMQDSISVNIADITKVITNKKMDSDTWIERTYWSVPDSAGNQYPTMTERLGNKTNVAENQERNTATNAVAGKTRQTSDEQRDSIVYVEKSNTETGQQIVEVERQLSWWEKTRIYGFYLLAALFVVIYRKPIWSLLRKFILRMPP